ncbi:uncharacterized protein V1510DRAFT_405971 [Dipodascopsis tothii]|uniref:uncharacterized protein n=1 Tax=Dipodascopsis tothii TaxID=44089 RepID=UPI0034CFBEAD
MAGSADDDIGGGPVAMAGGAAAGTAGGAGHAGGRAGSAGADPGPGGFAGAAGAGGGRPGGRPAAAQAAPDASSGTDSDDLVAGGLLSTQDMLASLDQMQPRMSLTEVSRQVSREASARHPVSNSSDSSDDAAAPGQRHSNSAGAPAGTAASTKPAATTAVPDLPLFTKMVEERDPHQIVRDVSRAERSISGIYSSSGFDMANILLRVATRPQPQIDIGPVDMSCAFIVCDAQKIDFPIVYVSNQFERLTGYTLAEIVDRNCRFLQSPDGKVVAGETRRFCDHELVVRMKTSLLAGEEIQCAIVNYKRGGEAFANLLTMIPITWDGPEIAFYVGFQVDLHDQPQAILDASKSLSYNVNYRRSQLPAQLSSDARAAYRAALGVGKHGRAPALKWDDAAEILSTIGTYDMDITAQLLSNAFLSNAEDLIYVISTKGVFFYCSPSSRKILEYAPDELVGTSLFDITHQSDVVMTGRELKEMSTSGPLVSMLFRVRRKSGSYVWLESYGKPYTDFGKGRKCIILVGRERPMYHFSRQSLSLLGHVLLPPAATDSSSSSGESPYDTASRTSSVTSPESGREDGSPAAGGGVPPPMPTLLPPAPAAATTRATPTVSTTERAWCKVSPTGIVLFAGSNSRGILGFSANELFGKTLQSVTTFRQRSGLYYALERAFKGETVAIALDLLKHVQEGPVPTFGLEAPAAGRTVLATIFPGTVAQLDPVVGSLAAADSFPNVEQKVKHKFLIAAFEPVTAEALAYSKIMCGEMITLNHRTARPLVAAPARPDSRHAQFDRATAAADDNLFVELDVERATSWQYELHQMRMQNKRLQQELGLA